VGTACNYRKCNIAENAFPIPLLDALAAYEHLVNVEGYTPSNIIVFGQSAGGGLAWSLTAYLAALTRLRPASSLHVPRSVVMVSVSGQGTERVPL
jgi:acetyl esterase/lipase